MYFFRCLILQRYLNTRCNVKTLILHDDRYMIYDIFDVYFLVLYITFS